MVVGGTLALLMGARATPAPAVPVRVRPEVQSRPSVAPTLVRRTGAELVVVSGAARTTQRRVRLEREAEGVSLTSSPGGRVTFTEAEVPWTRAHRAVVALQARGATTVDPVDVELEFWDPDRGNRWWSRLRLVDGEPHRVVLELPMLRYDRGLVPRWGAVDRWGLSFPSGGEVRIDAFEVEGSADGSGPRLGPRQLRALFPEPGEVRTATAGSFVVLTDAPELDLPALRAALGELEERLHRVLPRVRVEQGSVPLLVFATDRGYREFWRDLGRRSGRAAPPLPEDQGYTWLGIATASYSERHGKVRPIYVHEASHALIERGLGLAAQRSWLFEGLGTLEQLQVSRQNIAEVYRSGLTSSYAKVEVGDLVNGAPISTGSYWQATLMLEWLLTDPERTGALVACVDDMARAGHSDLRPLLERRFGVDLPAFSAGFWSWAWRRYAQGPGS